ncbi:kelch domain-containing protein 1 [Gastrophryne carolinensis]
MALQLSCVAGERSGHCACADQHWLYVWGGYVTIEENEVYLPNDEIWAYDSESGLWKMHVTNGDLPPSMSGSCAACLSGKLYLFGGYDDAGYSNQLYYMDVRSECDTFTWKHVTNLKGRPPTPRDKLSCWVYKERIIYFGGYGCRTHSELDDCFDVHYASWEEQLFWGWNNDVHVFDTKEETWMQPEVKSAPPQPRAAHSCALLGNKGYVFGGRVLETRVNDLSFLDLDTWTWRTGIQISGEKPEGRSWHTLTTVGDDHLFLFGGLSAESVPISDGWLYSVSSNEWKQLTYLPKDQPRLWHTACLGQDGEVMVFGGSNADLLTSDTGHCNDLLIFQTQPHPLLRLCLDAIGQSPSGLAGQIPSLPRKLQQQATKKVTFWMAAEARRRRNARLSQGYDDET